MANKSYRSVFASALLGMTMLVGCFITEQEPEKNYPPVVQKPTKPDTGKLDTLAKPPVVVTPDTTTVKPPLVIKNNGWDDFPNKYLPTLKELSAKMTKLPLPYGVRYNSVNDKPPSKVAARADCPDGPREVFGLDHPKTGLYVVDTIRYVNMQGVVSCAWDNLNMAKVTHDRYIMDLTSGEAWEHIEDSISEEVVLPRHAIHGSGRIKLHSKLEFALDAYHVDMMTPYGQPEAIVTGGNLKMTWKNGYWFDLQIVKAMPFKINDLFPIQGTPAVEKVMSGAIKNDTTTVGYMDLYADHSVAIRDWTGKLVEQ